MNVPEAINLVNTLATRPGYSLMAEDYGHRFETGVLVRLTLTDAHRSELELAPEYSELVPGGANQSFVLVVGPMSENDVVRAVIDLMLRVDAHEHREFTRRRDSLVAPFHPHTIDGMRRWGDETADLTYGMA